jgi:capsular polysaccharide biosynthesis protein
MELNEAARRIRRHWLLLVLFVGLGSVAGILLARGPDTFSASTRLVLEAQYPTSRSESAAIADTAQAIATSPSAVASALATVGVTKRDAVEIAEHEVSVSPLGTSGVVQLTVRDRSPRVAAAIANALAADVIKTGLTVSSGRAQRILAEFDRRIDALDRQIASADRASLSALVEERAAVQVERVNVLSSEAGRSQPSIISRATPPARVDAASTVAYAALGALLGLILGVGVVGLLEIVRPTLIGGDVLARELDVPLLGTVPAPPDETAALTALGPIAQRLRLAADTTDVADAALLSVGPNVNLGHLADRLEEVTAEVEVEQDEMVDAQGTVEAVGGRGTSHSAPRRDTGVPSRRSTLRIRPFDFARQSRSSRGGAGIVVVAPTVLPRSALAEAANLLGIVSLPVLGLIAYEPSGWTGRGRGGVGSSQPKSRVVRWVRLRRSTANAGPEPVESPASLQSPSPPLRDHHRGTGPRRTLTSDGSPRS